MSVFLLGIASTQVQHLALGPLELHEFPTDPPLKPVRVPLDGALPSSMSTALHSLESSANFMRVHLIPLAVLLTKMMSNSDPSTDP